jgi:hypothetical protein
MIPYFNLDAPLISTNFGEEFLDIAQDEEEKKKPIIIWRRRK